MDSSIKFASVHLEEEDVGLIKCPYKNYRNNYFRDPNEMKVDLYRYDIMYWYTR